VATGWRKLELELSAEDWARLERATAAHNARWSERTGVVCADFRPADMALGIILVELVQRGLRTPVEVR
jgi:hypothetical protein